MDKRSQILKIITAIAIILAVILGTIFLLKKSVKPVSNIETDKTVEIIPTGPVAQADLSIPAASGSTNSLSIYKIIANGGKYSLTNIQAKKGDNVDISITAIDRDYDFVVPAFGIRQVIKKGETKPAIFQVTTSGIYRFYCEVCGGEGSQAKGSITVNP